VDDLPSTDASYTRFQISNYLDVLTVRYNIAPGQMVPVIIANSPRRIVLMRWGLIRPWVHTMVEGVGSAKLSQSTGGVS
jgi:putative SOS response-associated peptidase YedK